MTRRMSCSLTVDAVRARTKTVTRRHYWTWRNLKPGDRLTLVEKAMGLPKGSTQVVLAEVRVVSNTEERLLDMTDAECVREGFPDMTWPQFVRFWCDSHKIDYPPPTTYMVRRIEFVYLCELCQGTEWYVDEFGHEQACHKCYDGTAVCLTCGGEGVLCVCTRCGCRANGDRCDNCGGPTDGGTCPTCNGIGLHAPCRTCNDTGEIEVDSMTMYGIPGGWVPDKCPDCDTWKATQLPATPNTSTSPDQASA